MAGEIKDRPAYIVENGLLYCIRGVYEDKEKTRLIRMEFKACVDDWAIVPEGVTLLSQLEPYDILAD